MAIEAICIRVLVVAPENVRKVDAPIDDLVASIAAHGLLQNLVGYRDEEGKLAVTAGGRRTRALHALAENKAVKGYRGTTRVPVDIRERSEAMRELSLAENTLRHATHPLDEAQAYAELVDAGATVAEIAGRFAQTERHVEGRLRLGRLCPEACEAYRAGAIALDHARALTLATSHEIQQEALAAFLAAPEWNRSADTIRVQIARGEVRPNDRLARFVTLEAYLAAGGEVIRDLFSQAENDVVALTDSGLLHRLAQERLIEHARTIAECGWKWIETSVDTVGHDVLARYEHVYPTETPLSDEEAGRLGREEERIEALVAALEEGTDLDSEDGSALTDERREQLQAEYHKLDASIAALEASTTGYTDEDKARAGVIVTVSWSGELYLHEGLVRPEDVALPAAAGEGDGAPANDPDGTAEGGFAAAHPSGPTPITPHGQENEAREAQKSAGISQALSADLGAYRQQILKAAVAANPGTALDLVVHAMVTGLFSYGYDRTPVSATFVKTDERVPDADLDDTVAGAELKAFAELLPILASRPKDPVELFEVIRALEQEEKLRLLAYCTAMTLNAGMPSVGTKAQKLADRVGAVLGIDVAAYWRPTKDRYFGRVKKSHLLEVLDQVGFSKLARELGAGKKDPIVNGVTRLFDPASRPHVLTEEQVTALDTWLPPSMAFSVLDAEVGADDGVVDTAAEPAIAAAE